MDHLFRRRFAKGKPIKADQVEPKEAESVSKADPRASLTMTATKEQEPAGGTETGSIPGTSSPGLAQKPRARADRVISGGLCKARRTKTRFLPKSVPLWVVPEQKRDKKETEGELCKARRTTPRFLPKSVPLSAAPQEKKDKKESETGGEEEQKEREEIEDRFERKEEGRGELLNDHSSPLRIPAARHWLVSG
ncbi:unnamed protein product [Clonostachys rhizophaga]|uniref:Uncharacterized protein n=1 Tax=Clonostachys rhizophaga TaxID=160324 RepID=A0A9N9W073_9HYPO|nr:unnamed protein product [Clonostachys rhizophaga]